MVPRLPLGVRDDLLDLAPYVAQQVTARFRMNTNEFPYPPPAELVEEVTEQMKATELNRYPDKNASRLTKALSEYLEWQEEGLWIANGSNEVFLHLFLAFGGPGRKSMTFEPTYSLHSLIPKITGTTVVQSMRNEELAIDLDEAVKAIRAERPDIVVVCSPNNPSGACEPLGVVRALIEESTGLVVVDEAYGEFAPPDESVRPLLNDYPNLVVVKTFSKAWRLAGVRIGYLLGNPLLATEMARVRLPYHLSSLTQLIGEAAIRHVGATLEVVDKITAERDRLAIELQAMGIRAFHSHANFVLFQVDDAPGFWEGLLSRGVLVRNYAAQPGLEDCLRVTAGLPEETDAFLQAAREVMDERL